MVAISSDPAGNLPVEVTNFVGRRQQVADLKQLLADHRLVTLTGAGGVGKTRLALRIAWQARRSFSDGTWFIDLYEHYERDPRRLVGTDASTADADALACLIMETLTLWEQPGTPPVRQLSDHLANRTTLLLLDNCEHVRRAAAELADALLAACPHLRVLATSREPLGLRAEVLYPVAPLPAPEPGDSLRAADLTRSAAVELFLARARASLPTFEVRPDNAAAVAALCRRLDGLPLAIELVSPRLRALSPQQILDRLDDRFALLGRGTRGMPARQQTLRACLDWSYDLCDEAEQVLWGRLAVFTGGFELDAAEGVCADAAVPVDKLPQLITGLVDKSILVRDVLRDDQTGARYRMLESIHDYGADRLHASGQVPTLWRRHCIWYRELVSRAGREWIGPRQAYWLERLAREHRNIRAAIEYALSEPGQAEDALHIAATVPWAYWATRGLFGEGRRWLDQALALVPDQAPLRAHALLLSGRMAYLQGDLSAAGEQLSAGERLAEAAGTADVLANAAYTRAIGQFFGNDPAAAAASCRRGLQLLDTSLESDLETRLGLLVLLGAAAGAAGDPDGAEAGYREVIRATEHFGGGYYRSYALWALGLQEWRAGRFDEAADRVSASLRIKHEKVALDRYGMVLCLEAVAWICGSRRRHRQAAYLLGAADAVWREIGMDIRSHGHLIHDHDDCVRQSRAALGVGGYDAAFGEGRTAGLDGVVAQLLREDGRAAPVMAAPPVRLTRREQQIAELVAQGLSNREIAAALVISTRTAEAHVQNILTKLGLTGRAQVGAWLEAAAG